MSASTFHAHLDDCAQCRENPFQLCSTGHRILHGQDVHAEEASVSKESFNADPGAAIDTVFEKIFGFKLNQHW